MSATRPAAFAAQMRKGGSPVFCLLYGDEPYFIEDARRLLRGLCAAEDRARERIDLDDEADAVEAVAEQQTASLFSARVFIEAICRGAPGRRAKDAIGKLREIAAAQNPADPDAKIALAFYDLPYSAKRAAWFGEMTRRYPAMDAKPLAREETPAWVREKLRAQGQSASAEAIDFLADLTEGNLVAAASEIEKLGLRGLEGEIDLAQMRAAAAADARYDLFALTDAIVEGKPARVFTVTRGLFDSGYEPPQILWAINEPLQQILAWQCGVAPRGFRAGKLRSIATVASPAVVADLIERAGYVDRAIKGLERAEPLIELSRLAIRLAALAQNPRRTFGRKN